MQLARVGDDRRVGRVDAVDVGVDLADAGAQGVGQRHRGGVGAAAAQRGDVLAGRDALKAGDQRDLAAGQRLLDAQRRDAHDLGLGVDRVGDDARLRAGEAHRLAAERVDRHGQQRAADALARREQHVELALGRPRRDLVGHRQQLVGGVAARRDDRAHAVARVVGGHDAPGDVHDALGARPPSCRRTSARRSACATTSQGPEPVSVPECRRVAPCGRAAASRTATPAATRPQTPPARPPALPGKRAARAPPWPRLWALPATQALDVGGVRAAGAGEVGVELLVGEAHLAFVGLAGPQAGRRRLVDRRGCGHAEVTRPARARSSW